MIQSRRNQIIAQIFLITLAFLWLVPMIGMVMASFRPFSETASQGFFSWPDSLTMDNFENAWERGNMTRHWIITFIVVIPAVILVQGIIEHAEGNYNTAIERFRRLSAMQPHNRKAQNLLARSLYMAGDARDAANVLRASRSSGARRTVSDSSQ